MSATSRSRLLAASALSCAAVGASFALSTGPASASPAVVPEQAARGTTTFFGTFNTGFGAGKVSFAPSSSRTDAAVEFVPFFVPDKRFSDARVGDPNTPRNLQWSITPGRERGLDVVRNRASGKCLDIEQDREDLTGADSAVGARVVIRPCDGTKSQNWKINVATGNQFTFRNAWADLVLTKSGSGATLERFERRGRPQTFGQTPVEPVFS
jgi:hypothetical protein